MKDFLEYLSHPWHDLFLILSSLTGAYLAHLVGTRIDKDQRRKNEAKVNKLDLDRDVYHGTTEK